MHVDFGLTIRSPTWFVCSDLHQTCMGGGNQSSCCYEVSSWRFGSQSHISTPLFFFIYYATWFVNIFSSCKQFTQIVNYVTAVISLTVTRDWKMTSRHQIWKLVERVLSLVASCRILLRWWISDCDYLHLNFLICKMSRLPQISCCVPWSRGITRGLTGNLARGRARSPGFPHLNSTSKEPLCKICKYICFTYLDCWSANKCLPPGADRKPLVWGLAMWLTFELLMECERMWC